MTRIKKIVEKNNIYKRERIKKWFINLFKSSEQKK